MQFGKLAAVIATVALLGVSQAQAQQQERARAFVDSVSFTSSSNALARWTNRICVGAVGLAPDQARALVDRISERAQAVGLRAGAPGCTANVMVIYAPDSDRLSREIIDQRRDLLGYSRDDDRWTLGQDAMNAFANEQRAVRWWHVSSVGRGSLRPTDGTTYQPSGQSAAQAAATGDGAGNGTGASPTSDLQGAQGVRSHGSRVRNEAHNSLTYALVVVDARRVANLPADAWMDYVALVSLAQIDASAQTDAYPTVLNLFSGPNPPTGLTPWDVAFLEGLYDARDEPGNRQAAAISRRMASVAAE
ncbi:MAG: hypothetical protein R3C27_12300 [Hyphomonadaceae bacterium]